MSQKLIRLSPNRYGIVDKELLLICSAATSCGNVELIGSAFLTRMSGWRLLRRGLVDIGYSPLPELAIERLIDDAASIKPSTISDLEEAVRAAFPT